MTPPAHTVRVQGWRAAVLALVVGYIDSYTFLHYKVFTSFMSGNTTLTGLRAGEGRLAEAGLHLLPIPFFVVGTFVGTLLLCSVRHPLRRLGWAVAALLSVGLAAACFGPLTGWFNVVLFSLAMGILSAAITRIGEQPVSVGFVTGDLYKLGEHLALAARGAPVSHSQGSWDTHGWRAAALTTLWSSLLLGAVLGGAAMAHLVELALLPPIVVLVILAARGNPPADDAT